jgi:hypothetical protein
MYGAILVSQHWLNAVLGIPLSVWAYVDLRNDEENLMQKFGDDYKRYMEKVPRMNIVVGIIRLLRRSETSSRRRLLEKRVRTIR